MQTLYCTLTAAHSLTAELTSESTLRASMKDVNAIVKTDAISITENGVYNAPGGYGYTRVTVNVPIPSNYGLITYNGSYITVS